MISHTKSGQHKNNAKIVETNRPVTAFVSAATYPRVKAELNTVALLARKNLSFNLLNELVETLHCIANDSKGINGMTCSAFVD